MNLDVKTVVAKLGKLEGKLKQKIESGALYSEAKRFASGQAKVLRQKVKSSNDVKKIVGLIAERRKQIEKLAKQIPGDVKIVRSYIQSQRKELERIGNQLIKQAKSGKIDPKKIKLAINVRSGKTSSKKAAPRKTTKKAAKRK
jgi:hypothetical protein